MNKLDFLILIIVVVSAFSGYAKGLLSVLGRLATTLIALVIAVLYRTPLAMYMEEQFGAITLLAQSLGGKIPQPAFGTSVDKYLPALKTLPYVQKQLTSLAEMIIIAISFVLLYIVVSLLLKLLWRMLEKPFGDGLLGKINQVVGMLLLVSKNLLLMAILLGITVPFIKHGVDIGIKSFANTNQMIEQSWSSPYLLSLFTWMAKLVGLGA